MNSGEKILIKSKYTRVSLILKTQKLKVNSNLSRCITSIRSTPLSIDPERAEPNGSICQCESHYTTKELRKQICVVFTFNIRHSIKVKYGCESVN